MNNPTPFLGSAVGAILAAIIQSFSASVGFPQSLCYTGTVTFSQQAQTELESHKHLSALKAGKLRERAMFSERFAKYKTQYVFPGEN